MKRLVNALLEFDFINICSNAITYKLNAYLNKEGFEYEKLKLGVEVVLLSLSKLILVLILSIYFNILIETIVMIISHTILRRNAFGLHAKNSNVCLIITLIMFIVPPILLKNLYLNNYIVTVLFLLFNTVLYKNAPADTENHPLLGAKLRKKLKTKTWVYGNILMIITVLIPFNNLKPLVLISVLYIVIMISPITYKILKRRCNNYEIYEH